MNFGMAGLYERKNRPKQAAEDRELLIRKKNNDDDQEKRKGRKWGPAVGQLKCCMILVVGIFVGYIAIPMAMVELNPSEYLLKGQDLQLRNLEDDPWGQLVQKQKIFSTQSIPTATAPNVMMTSILSDHIRKKILITGGAGFVGSHLVDKLMMEGHEVTVLDNFFTGQKKNIAHWLRHPNFSLMVHDVTEPIQLEVDEIYHLACPASPPHYQFNAVKTIKTSTEGTLNMLGLAKRVRAKILLTSTSEIYGDPEVHPQREDYWGNVNTVGPRSCYDEGKRVAETMMYCYKNQNKVAIRVARIFNTFGPRMHPNDGRVVSNFIIQSLQNKPITIYGKGEQTRSFQYVSDLVDGLHTLMNGDYDGPVNLGNPHEYTVKEFADYIKRLTKSESEIKMLEKNQDDPSKRRPDISLAKEKIGWSPKISVEDGLIKTIAYFQTVLDQAGEIIPTGPGASKPQN
jgi:UDP-glucuronate decarboxylase